MKNRYSIEKNRWEGFDVIDKKHNHKDGERVAFHSLWLDRAQFEAELLNQMEDGKINRMIRAIPDAILTMAFIVGSAFAFIFLFIWVFGIDRSGFHRIPIYFYIGSTVLVYYYQLHLRTESDRWNIKKKLESIEHDSEEKHS